MRSAGLIAGWAVVLAAGAARADRVPYPDHVVDTIAGCTDDHDVVGGRRCLPYGSWSRTGSNVFAEFGFHARRLTSPAATNVAARRVGGAPAAASDGGIGLSFVERIAVRISRPLYIGAEAELGTPFSLDDQPDAPIVLLGGVGVAGLRVALPFGAVGGELVGGGRILGTQAGVETWTEAVVEARGRVSLWLSPWCSIGVVAGKSLLRRDEWMAGVALSVDTYAFGLDRSP